MNPWGASRAALAFLTRLPVGGRAIDSKDCSWAPAYFPVIGAGLGLASLLALRGLWGLGAWASAIVVTAGLAYTTGAFHEDGLADTADALGGFVSRERALEILKDSRIGSYGAVALVLCLLLRVALLARLGPSAVAAIVGYGMLARVGPVWLMTSLAHASPHQGKLKDLQQIPRSRAYVATAFALALVTVLVWLEPSSVWRFIAAGLGVTLVTLWVGRLAQRRLGGITGDLLGAAEQGSELVVLMVFAWQLQ